MNTDHEQENITENGKFRASKALLIAFSHYTHDIYTAILAPILPLLIEKLSLSYALSGLMIFFVRSPAILNPFFGMIADRISLRFFVILAPAVTAIAMSLTTIAPDYYILCGLLLIAGISSASYHVPAPVLLRNFSGSRVGTGMSFFMFGGELARTTGPLLIVGAISLWGLEGSYKIVVLGIGASLFLFLKLKHLPAQRTVTAKVSSLKGFKDTLLKFRKLFLVVAGLNLSKSFLIISLTSFLPTFLTTKGIQVAAAGIMLSALELAGAGGAFTSGTLSDKIGRKNMLMITYTTAPIILLIFINSAGWVLYPMLVLLGFLSFTSAPVMMALVLENRTDFPASANSIYMTLNFVIGSLVALIFGILGDIVSLKNVYYISAILTFSGIFFTMMIPKAAAQDE